MKTGRLRRLGLLLALLLVMALLLLRGMTMVSHWTSSSIPWMALEFPVNHNDPVTIQAEVNSPEFRTKLARAAGVGEWRLRTLTIRLSDSMSSFDWEASDLVSHRVVKAFSSYIFSRAEGHSAEYCCDAMMLGGTPPSAQYGFLADIRKETGNIPEKWIYQPATIFKSKEGYTLFAVLDGEMAWQYGVSYHPDGSIKNVSSYRADPVEYSPIYTSVIAEVEKRVGERMKADGIQGLGSCHSFWRFKQEMLKEKGIRWRSPSEMNPGSMYD